MFRTASLITLAAIGLAACSTPANQPLSANAEAELEKQLAGRVAGPPQRCISSFSTANMVIIDNQTLLFREGGTIYRTNTGGGCSPLADGGYTLITNETPGGALCRGTIARVVPQGLNRRITMGNCVMGDFVPYRRP